MLLRDFKFNLINISCLPESVELNALVQLQDDISSVFPYLNAEVRRCNYNHEAKLLDFMYQGHIITIEPLHMKVTGLKDENQAKQVIEYIMNLVNGTWDRRESIEPIFEYVRPATPLQLLALLPKTNCGKCEEPTCLAFALKVINEQKTLEGCTELNEPDMSEKAKRAESLLKDRHAEKGAR